MRTVPTEADRSVDGLAHDLRNLLSCIRGYCDTLMTRDLPLLRRHAHCQRVTALVDRCVLLVDTLQGKPGELAGVSVAQDVAEFAARAHEPLFQKKGVHLGCVAEGGPTFVAVEPQALLRMLHNLLNNALKFTPRGGLVTIEVAAPAADECRIVVRDTGIGMAPGLLARVFEPFYQGAPAGPGSRGLGLAIAKDIAVRVSARLEAESSGAGLGSTFRLAVPLYRRRAQEKEPEAPVPALDGLAS
ncbi:MAG: HAMP domain-containing histidine kinase [Elusimicrobia bacterium]|nr:HAMP domain-containing histidine kinase [Elusimicrobiota bacterium]